MDRLSIIDPNNPNNDIAGGSSNTAQIMYHFKQAYEALRDRMALLDTATGRPEHRGSILYPILAGNYESFRVQRKWLEGLDSSKDLRQLGFKGSCYWNRVS